MGAEYLFQKDKHYDVSYDTGDKSIQCGRHVDVFKFWLMWKAKVWILNVIMVAVFPFITVHLHSDSWHPFLNYPKCLSYQMGLGSYTGLTVFGPLWQNVQEPTWHKDPSDQGGMCAEGAGIPAHKDYAGGAKPRIIPQQTSRWLQPQTHADHQNIVGSSGPKPTRRRGGDNCQRRGW